MYFAVVAPSLSCSFVCINQTVKVPKKVKIIAFWSQHIVRAGDQESTPAECEQTVNTHTHTHSNPPHVVCVRISVVIQYIRYITERRNEINRKKI